MKRFISFSAVLGLIFALNGVAHAIDFAHDGKVDVIQALAVAETTELDFGTVSDNDGTITLDLADTISVDANGISAGGSIASGVYTITGQSGNVVTVVLTAGAMPAGLDMDNFTTSEADLANVTLTGGTLALTIGADLTVTAASAVVGADQVLAFTIGVTYN